MTHGTHRSAGESTEKLREIPKWTERYALNRTLPLFVVLAIMGVSAAALGPLAYMVKRAHDAGEAGQAIVWLLLSAAAMFWCLWLGYGDTGRLESRIADRLSTREGEVLTGPEARARTKDIRSSWAFLLCSFCLLMWSGIGLLKLLPVRLWSSALAIFLVPFLYYVSLVEQRGAVSPFLLAWPALYGIHSLLVALGAPIYINGGPGGLYKLLNILIPTIGYALVCALAGHIYSRFALRRLRMIARSPDAAEKSK